MTDTTATSLQYTLADAFTDRPLQGNPVAVFNDGSELDAATMQHIAREMNLSETVFVLPPRDGGDLRVRIFTPVNELPFAGHPTLGTAVAVGSGTSRTTLRMETGMGIVPFRLHRRGGCVVGATMDQPVPTREPYPRTDDLLAALGVPAASLPVEVYRNGPRHALVGVADLDTLSQLTPDHRALATHPDLAVECVAGTGTSWRMRMFSPTYGVVEDAATGSAAGPLAAHLVRHGVVASGQQIQIEQGIDLGRRSVMHAAADYRDATVTRARVHGHAVIVGRGELYPFPPTTFQQPYTTCTRRRST